MGVDLFYRVEPYLPEFNPDLTVETQRHMVFAYCAESRSKALGQAKLGVAGFTGFDLNATLKHDKTHYSHSREFRSNVAAEEPFWKRVFVDCGFIKAGN